MAPLQARSVPYIMAPWAGLEILGASQAQSLWAGYGDILLVEAGKRRQDDDVDDPTPKYDRHDLILKYISPPPNDGSEGHVRKMLSYQVEQRFYTHVAPRLDERVAVPSCIASTSDMEGRKDAERLDGITATLMTDLRPRFPVEGEKRAVLSHSQVFSSLEWLARFHGQSWALLPDSFDGFLLPPLEEMARRQVDPAKGGSELWLNGGYTYLATRRTEYKKLAQKTESEWSQAFCVAQYDEKLPIAELAADMLTPRGRPFETYIHGDVKSENLFSTDAGDKVAFFDFQYVGLGLGVCDLAKLFTCSVPVAMLTDHRQLPLTLEMEQGEKKLLEYYYGILLTHPSKYGNKSEYDWDVFVLHWQTALVDWCRFQASWGFWGNTNWLQARVRSILRDKAWRDWLQGAVPGAARG
ncbi:hypothetical protein S40288_00945 [Stachybotrys chartarum IBT 40288]|nr:hypothetical protein S40288_00945 [Stachybotrys chartarum IBT 40288]